jgi:hypothetical protein
VAHDEFRIQQVLARYVQATDARDADAQSSLYSSDGVLETYFRNDQGDFESSGNPIVGADELRDSVAHFRSAHPEDRPSHHVTTDHIIELDGDRAHLNAQFLAFEVHIGGGQGTSANHNVSSAPGYLHFYASGYYDMDFRLLDGHWKIVRNRVMADLKVLAANARDDAVAPSPETMGREQDSDRGA